MNAETFCEHFQTFADAPHGVEKLRDLILQLAVQGRLIPQNPNDEPAKFFEQRVGTYFSSLIEAKTIRKPEPLPAIPEEYNLFDLPKNWIWRRLGSVLRISSGDGLTSSQMTKTGEVPVYGGNGVNGYHDIANVKERTLVIGRVGFYCGSIHLTPELAWVTDNAFITTFPHHAIDIHFLYWLLKATNLRENDNATAQPVISGKKVYPTIVAFPPLAEQRRIVEKVNQLLGLSDELAARQAGQREKRQRLVGATLDRLVTCRDPAKFPTHTNRLRNHFDRLFDTTIPQLRQTILQLAVQGQLVPQDPDDESRMCSKSESKRFFRDSLQQEQFDSPNYCHLYPRDAIQLISPRSGFSEDLEPFFESPQAMGSLQAK